jgi:hypothetical protein
MLRPISATNRSVSIARFGGARFFVIYGTSL